MSRSFRHNSWLVKSLSRTCCTTEWHVKPEHSIPCCALLKFVARLTPCSSPVSQVTPRVMLQEAATFRAITRVCSRMFLNKMAIHSRCSWPVQWGAMVAKARRVAWKPYEVLVHDSPIFFSPNVTLFNHCRILRLQ